MAEKQQNGMTGLGEISTIRDILMGQHIAQYSQKFEETDAERERMEKALQEKIDKLHQETHARIDALHQETQARIDALEKTMLTRFELLEQLLSDQVSRLDEKIQTTSVNDKAALGRMLTDIGKTLMGE